MTYMIVRNFFGITNSSFSCLDQTRLARHRIQRSDRLIDFVPLFLLFWFVANAAVVVAGAARFVLDLGRFLLFDRMPSLLGEDDLFRYPYDLSLLCRFVVRRQCRFDTTSTKANVVWVWLPRVSFVGMIIIGIITTDGLDDGILDFLTYLLKFGFGVPRSIQFGWCILQNV